MRKTQSTYQTKYAEGIADVDEAETTEDQDNVDEEVETESQEEEDLKRKKACPERRKQAFSALIETQVSSFATREGRTRKIQILCESYLCFWL